MIQRYNGIEKDDEGAYVYYDDHLAAIARDREERDKELTYWKERWKSTKGQLDSLQYALKRNKEREDPDTLSADLVRLAGADKAKTNFADDDYVTLWKWIRRLKGTNPELTSIFVHKTSEVDDWHNTPREAVDAALQEIDDA